jgi:hypothetical protein
MLVATIVTCLALVAILPFLVYCGKRFFRRAPSEEESTEQQETSSSDGEQRTAAEDEAVARDASPQETPVDAKEQREDDYLGAVLDASPRTGPLPRRRKRYHEQQHVPSERFGDVNAKQQTGEEEAADVGGSGGVASTPDLLHKVGGLDQQWSFQKVDSVGRDSLKGDGPHTRTSPTQGNKDTLAQHIPDNVADEDEWKPSCIELSYDNLLEIAEVDYEAKRICRLAAPFVIEALVEGIANFARVAIIGHYIGTKELSAYIVVDLFVSLTTEFFGGFTDSIATVGSHAVGVGNKKLAGQYVQIAMTAYTIFFVPIFIFWYFFTDDLLKWMGFDDDVAKIGQDFAHLLLFAEYLSGTAVRVC